MTQNQTPTKTSTALIATGVAWLAAVLAGSFLMLNYGNSSGPMGNPPERWPSASLLQPKAGEKSLVMFVHPHCPCSRASVGELALLMAHCQGRVNARVLFLKAAGETSKWTQTELWRMAAAIPGVTVAMDDTGREAKRFGAQTSGSTVLYNGEGRLVFHGGITAARGHSGDNAGRSALQALILNSTTKPGGRTPVFGCSLFDLDAQCGTEGEACKR